MITKLSLNVNNWLFGCKKTEKKISVSLFNKQKYLVLTRTALSYYVAWLLLDVRYHYLTESGFKCVQQVDKLFSLHFLQVHQCKYFDSLPDSFLVFYYFFLSKVLNWWCGWSSQIDFSEMCTFQLEMREMHKTADFHPNLLVSWELLIESYQIKADLRNTLISRISSWNPRISKDPYQA